MQTFMQTASARKLSPALQRRLLALEREALGAQLDLLLGLKNALTEAEKLRLQQAGITLRSVIGTVATATAPAGKIPEVASFDFIDQIELSTRLRSKGDNDEKP